jgi:hypothetical protein
MNRRKASVLTLTLILGIALGAAAQGLWTGAAINNPIASTITNANCTAPTAGTTNVCWTGTGAQISCNGAAYIPGVSCTPVSAGITGITKNGVAVPVTNGVAALTIGATSTATAPAATFATNGALTLSPPTVTTSIQ